MPRKCVEIAYVECINKMAGKAPLFKRLLLIAFLGFQAHCCGSIPRGADPGTSPGDPDHNETLYAVCEMRPSSTLLAGQPQIHGQVLFMQTDPTKALKVMVNLQGLPHKDKQSRAIHIHEYGDLSDGCNACGGHYNPLTVPHPHHPGDLGNFPSEHTRIRTLLDTPATLYGGRSVLGRSVVIHEKEDDMGLGGDTGSLLHGNAGRRLGCCVIGVSSSKYWNKTTESFGEEGN
ncbi:hypothetical protein AAFF_G00191080 [Aldrovandia affinis]|uniref:Superoxide dismutase [Cu-Zn] n=1 Tax=Aldrovandia affinis TaxID=143900 RepID=A0AAD7RJ85_9TELE|nr:hypothetical protein AAFF_G00191080 [Aldrovandia affinis]